MEDTKRAELIGSALMDEHFNCTLASEEVYSYFEVTEINNLPAYVHEDDRDRMLRGFSDLKKEKIDKFFTVLRFKNRDGVYAPCAIEAVKDVRGYNLEISDVQTLSDRYKECMLMYKKICCGLNMLKPAFMFDYTPSKDNIVVFIDEIRIFEGSLDGFKQMLIEKEIVDKAHEVVRDNLIENVRKQVPDLECKINTKITADDEHRVPVYIRTCNIYNKNGNAVEYIVGVGMVGEKGQGVAEKIYAKSNLDPLTGLYNKTAIKNIAENVIKTAQEDITYIMLDLDHFKEVNDNYGHMFGDEVIFNAARIIKDVIGRRGYVGRVGGDEFFIVLKGSGYGEELRNVLRAMRSQIEWAYKDKLGSIHLTASIGTATYPRDADNYDDLFKLADRCLYIAKVKGRNRYVFYEPEKHGTLAEIKADDNQIKIVGDVSDTQRLDFTYDAVERINDWGLENISSIYREMMSYFGADMINIYAIKGKALVCQVDKDEDNPCSEINLCTCLDEIRHNFRENSIFSFGQVYNIKTPYPVTYKKLEEGGVKSFFIYAVKHMGEITHLISVFTTQRSQKWSETAIKLMGIIFKTTGAKLVQKK